MLHRTELKIGLDSQLMPADGSDVAGYVENMDVCSDCLAEVISYWVMAIMPLAMQVGPDRAIAAAALRWFCYGITIGREQAAKAHSEIGEINESKDVCPCGLPWSKCAGIDCLDG